MKQIYHLYTNNGYSDTDHIHYTFEPAREHFWRLVNDEDAADIWDLIVLTNSHFEEILRFEDGEVQ